MLFKETRRRLLLLFSTLVICLPSAASQTHETTLLWGDTHLHSSYSVDAYSTGNFSVDPEAAYRFAMGLPVLHPLTKMRIRIDRPLDFLVVADHAEMLQLQVRLEKHDPDLLASPTGQRLLKILEQDRYGVFPEIMKMNQEGKGKEMMQDIYTPKIRRNAWITQVDIAERYNQPGRFSTLIGWEWSSAPNWANLHRVIFTPSSGDIAKKFIPFSNYDSERPEDLWAWLEKTSAETGAEFVAIPHNSNMSNGMMFDMVDSDGRPISAEYARTRMRWEPVIEVTQVKGTSETHPALSLTDEFAGFEIRNKLLIGTEEKISPHSYARTALLQGLEIENNTGVNPYKFGLIGSTDDHTGLVSVDEANFYGKLAVDSLPEQRVNDKVIFPAWEMSASGLAAVWATENTRSAIAAAFKRKEVYATTGPRITLRVFGGYSFRPSQARVRNIAAVGYKNGVPMGGDLSTAPRGKAPSFLIHAAKDPQGANLDRIQVVKGWLDGSGVKHEHVYDAAWSGERSIGTDGKLQAVGNTVDIHSASYTNTIGTAQLATVWIDPDFEPNVRAFYYIRVLEIPTPRHQVYDAVALNIDPATIKQPTTIQERAYSSPIWYTP